MSYVASSILPIEPSVASILKPVRSTSPIVGSVWNVQSSPMVAARFCSYIRPPSFGLTDRYPSGRNDEKRRADRHMVEQPLGFRHEHPDAAVGGRVADRGRIGGSVDPDAPGREAHPARAERIAGAGRDRLQTLGPFGGRGRIPPRVVL